MVGKHLLKGWSKTQTLIALSSGESELYGICSGSARGIWTQELLKEMGFLCGRQMTLEKREVKVLSEMDCLRIVGSV